MLFDAAPYCEPFRKLKKESNFDIFGQISNCFTTTSVVSMMTGKMPSDLEDGGIGYESELNYKSSGAIVWPWENQLLLCELQNNGWEVEIFTDNEFFGDVISQKFTITYGDIHSREFITNIQKENSSQNKISFVLYNTYHDAIGGKVSVEEAESNIKSCLEYWDFDQKDSFFWMFADHGDFTKITEHIDPVGYMTWAMMKDNTDDPIIAKTDLISIRDFYPTIMNKAKIDIDDPIINSECKSVTSPLDLKRVYYVEDGRSHIDLQNSTSAAALKFDKWQGLDEEYKYSQVTLYRHRPGVVNRKGFPFNTNMLETLVRTRFNWI